MNRMPFDTTNVVRSNDYIRDERGVAFISLNSGDEGVNELTVFAWNCGRVGYDRIRVVMEDGTTVLFSHDIDKDHP